MVKLCGILAGGAAQGVRAGRRRLQRAFDQSNNGQKWSNNGQIVAAGKVRGVLPKEYGRGDVLLNGHFTSQMMVK